MARSPQSAIATATPPVRRQQATGIPISFSFCRRRHPKQVQPKPGEHPVFPSRDHETEERPKRFSRRPDGIRSDIAFACPPKRRTNGHPCPDAPPRTVPGPERTVSREHHNALSAVPPRHRKTVKHRPPLVLREPPRQPPSGFRNGGRTDAPPGPSLRIAAETSIPPTTEGGTPTARTTPRNTRRKEDARCPVR